MTLTCFALCGLSGHLKRLSHCKLDKTSRTVLSSTNTYENSLTDLNSANNCVRVQTVKLRLVVQTLYPAFEPKYPHTCSWLATGWTVPGSNPSGGKIFRTCPDRPWVPRSLLYNRYGVILGGKAAGAWRWSPTPPSAEVIERVELYLYSPSGPSWSVLGWPLPLLLHS